MSFSTVMCFGLVSLYSCLILKGFPEQGPPAGTGHWAQCPPAWPSPDPPTKNSTFHPWLLSHLLRGAAIPWGALLWKNAALAEVSAGTSGAILLHRSPSSALDTAPNSKNEALEVCLHPLHLYMPMKTQRASICSRKVSDFLAPSLPYLLCCITACCINPLQNIWGAFDETLPSEMHRL